MDKTHFRFMLGRGMSAPILSLDFQNGVLDFGDELYGFVFAGAISSIAFHR